MSKLKSCTAKPHNSHKHKSMRVSLTQVIEELTRIRDRAGDIEFESIVHGEIVEENTAQCFATETFHVVAVADADGYPVLPTLVVTPINRHY